MVSLTTQQPSNTSMRFRDQKSACCSQADFLFMLPEQVPGLQSKQALRDIVR